MSEWYEIVTGEGLEQGDFFPNLPIIVPSSTLPFPETGEPSIEDVSNITPSTYIMDVVVLSQSCDLALGKLNSIVCCPYWSLSSLENHGNEKIRNEFRNPKIQETIRLGNSPGYHMLAAFRAERYESEIRVTGASGSGRFRTKQRLEEDQNGVRVVGFRDVYTVPFSYLTDFARRRPNRLRLRSPYREHLAQAFARFFMRVGLPADIPPFKSKK